MDFDQAFKEVVSSEGCFSNDQQDPGNWTGCMAGQGELKGTKFGISACAYKQLDIANLALEEAKKIYYQDYWYRWIKLEGLSQALPDSLVFELFDASVNAGIGNATRFLQRALNVADDGRFGPVSIAALEHALINHGVSRLEQWFLAEKLNHYTALKQWDRYGRGWTKRVVKSLRNM